MWILASLLNDAKEEEVEIGFSIRNKPVRWIVFSIIQYWRMTKSVSTVAKESATAGFIHRSLIITEIHSWFWSLFCVLPKQDTSQTLVHGTINYFEKMLIKNNLNSTPPSGRDGE